MSTSSIIDNTQQNTSVAQTEAVRKFRPAANISQSEQYVDLHLALPGIPEDAISITSEGQALTVSTTADTETPWGKVSYQRSFKLHRDLNTQGISADLKNGVLHLRIPKQEQAQPQQIKISG